MALLFLIAAGLFIAFIVVKKDLLAERGRARFTQGAYNFVASPQQKLFSRAPRSGLATVAKPKNIFQSAHCELCSSPPRVQYRNESNFVFEFCYKHSVAKGPGLIESGFKKTASDL